MPCPVFNPTTCSEILLDHETQLIPPALENTVVFTKTIDASIDHVCAEKVVICGVINKTLTYTAVLENGTLVPDFSVIDEIPFEAVIDREDANEGDLFEITGMAIICEVSAQELNFGFKAGRRVAFKFREKEIVKVCVRKITVFSLGIAVTAGTTSCNVPGPIAGFVEVNGQRFGGIPVILTISGPATISPSLVFTAPDGTFNSTFTPVGPGEIVITASVTVNGFTETAVGPPITSPCV